VGIIGLGYADNHLMKPGRSDATMKQKRGNLRTATFAGGCFWCVEADFEKVNSLVEVISGYTGGHKENPTYEEVSAGASRPLPWPPSSDCCH
jgi:peptide methionine sulfoxide reductase msrA/msrB